MVSWDEARRRGSLEWALANNRDGAREATAMAKEGIVADETTPAPLSDAEIADIAERAAKATAGPWDGSDAMGYGDSVELYSGEYSLTRANGRETLAFISEENDAAFIAHVRTDIPRLLATLAAYREIVALMVEPCAAMGASGLDSCCFCGAEREWKHQADCPVTRARALLATQTPATGATAGEEDQHAPG